jgi:hypothetical protein
VVDIIVETEPSESVVIPCDVLINGGGVNIETGTECVGGGIDTGHCGGPNKVIVSVVVLVSVKITGTCIVSTAPAGDISTVRVAQLQFAHRVSWR